MRYFLVTYFQQPGGKYNESVKLDTKIRKRDSESASVIIDYETRKIVKSRFQGELGNEKGRDFDTINNFYKGHYPEMIAQLEAKYEVLEAAKEMVGTIINDAKEDVNESE